MEPRGLFCPNHSKQSPQKFVERYGQITKRFDNYKEAHQFLIGLRHQEGSGQFDARDYQVKSKPLAFDRLAEEWLDLKRPAMKPGGWQSIKAIMAHAQREWGQANIKSIRYAQIEDFFSKLDLSSKTKHNILTTLKPFWAWVSKRYGISKMEDWPDIGKVQMARRKTVDTATRILILSDIKEHEPFRVWLCIYGKVRPSEMLSINEGDIDRSTGIVTVRDTKEGEPKTFPLIGKHLGLVNRLPFAFDPQMPFFRHDGRRGHTKAGGRFSRQMIWAALKRACARHDIFDVDLYGFTRHSLLTTMRESHTFEDVKTMSGHVTNKAIDRYIVTESTVEKGLYEIADQALNPDNVKETYPRQLTTGYVS
jgi:Phage integrase family.